MKSKALTLVLSAGLFAASFAGAATPYENEYIENYREAERLPAPVSVITPFVSTAHTGTIVDLVFTVDDKGRPRGIKSLSRASVDLINKLSDAVSRWRFEPFRDENGEPVATKVRLPIHIVNKAERAKDAARPN